MPRDWPDYGATAGAAPVYVVPDMGEVAVRLGAVSRWDRRGNILFEEIFEGSFHDWDYQPSIDPGCTLALSPEQSLFGLVSAKIGLAAVVGKTVFFSKYFPRSVSSPLGLEVAIRLPIFSSEVFIFGDIAISPVDHNFGLRLTTNPNTVSYFGPGNDWVELSPAPNIAPGRREWHFLKVVYDPVTGKYKRLIVDGREWLLTAPCWQSPGDEDNFWAQISVQNLSGQADAAYIDGIVITTNEP